MRVRDLPDLGVLTLIDARHVGDDGQALGNMYDFSELVDARASLLSDPKGTDG